MELIPNADIVKQFTLNEGEPIQKTRNDIKLALYPRLTASMNDKRAIDKKYLMQMIPLRLANDLLNAIPVNNVIVIHLRPYYLQFKAEMQKDVYNEINRILILKGYRIMCFRNDDLIIKIVDPEEDVKEIKDLMDGIV